jgi:hypothetical protein
MSSNLMVLDEFGYDPLNREEARLLFRVVNYRYAKNFSMAITTNRGIAHWPSILANDEVLADAILDRLLHNATVLNIQGQSYRLKELDDQLRAVGVSHDDVGKGLENAESTGSETIDHRPTGEIEAGEDYQGDSQKSKICKPPRGGFQKARSLRIRDHEVRNNSGSVTAQVFGFIDIPPRSRQSKSSDTHYMPPGKIARKDPSINIPASMDSANAYPFLR